MGEIAEAMLDGTLCSTCGDYLGGDEGYPVQCAGCRRSEKREGHVPPYRPHTVKRRPPRDNEVACPQCGKVVKKVGLPHHWLDKHPGEVMP